MTRRIATSACRNVPFDEIPGCVIDLEPCRVLPQTEGRDPPDRRHDCDSRGGKRRVAMRAGEIALASYSAIFIFGPQRRSKGILTDPGCAGRHEILFQGTALWARSAVNDLLIQFGANEDRSGQLSVRAHAQWLRQLPQPGGSQRAPGSGRPLDFRDRRDFSTVAFDHFHLNCLGRVTGFDGLHALTV